MSKPPKPRTRVLIATPLGENGKGGVDRIMDVIRGYLRAHPAADLDVAFVTTRGKGSILLSPVFLAGAILAYVWRRATGRVDVLHVNIGRHGSALRKLVLSRIAHALGTPYVLHVHGAEFHDYWNSVSPRLAARLERLFDEAARTVVLGQVWADFIASKAPRARIEVVPNATFAPAEIAARAPGRPVHILFLGQIGPRKGAPELIQALAALHNDGAWRATLAGDGAVSEARAEIDRSGLAATVTVPGWVGPEQVNALLADADVLVLPSHHENLPMSVIEGMAYGLAVVTTPVGAVPDVIRDGETGLLHPVGDAAALAAALRRLIADEALRRRLGEAARAFHRANLDAPAFVARLKGIWQAAA